MTGGGQIEIAKYSKKNTLDEAVDALTTIWNYQELGFAFSGSQLLTVPTYIKSDLWSVTGIWKFGARWAVIYRRALSDARSPLGPDQV